jgi:deoxycytidylate deaminase
MLTGPCAKKHVVCFIKPRGSSEVIHGSNACLNPQPVCPREDHEDYSKCKTVCQQQGHAEEQAVAEAKRRGVDLKGASAVLLGHYWMCQNCGNTLREAGVTNVTIINNVPAPQGVA